MILELIYLFMPVYISNMVPVLARHVPFSYPMDFGIKWRGKRILGAHKTWRGFVLGTLIGGAFFLLQVDLGISNLEITPYSTLPYYFGFVMAAGALFGDAMKSLFKRRRGIKPGKPWIPFDQLDFGIGALFFMAPWYFPGWKESVLILTITVVGHICINHLAYYLKIRKEKW